MPSRSSIDEFLGGLERREHLRLARDWGALDGTSRLLETDLSEEAAGPDALLGEPLTIDFEFEFVDAFDDRALEFRTFVSEVAPRA